MGMERRLLLCIAAWILVVIIDVSSSVNVKKVLKPSVFSVASMPLLLIFWTVVTNNLGPDPAKALALETGGWALRFLLLTLAMTPMSQILGTMEFVKIRRMMGLFTFFYASLHFLVWLVFLLELRLDSFGEELLERPFITLGFAAYLILFLLAITSPRSMVLKLGRKWKLIHRSIYLAATVALLHLIWIVRSNFGEALVYGLVLAALFLFRLWGFLRKKILLSNSAS
jgi:sulfoxide reductase heme-binding subunit YedZ